MEFFDILMRLGLAILIGFFVGLEREKNHRPAGIKTHILVCMGATVVSLIQIHMIQDAALIIGTNAAMADALKTDVGRLGAAVISGIGFLGAGTILQRKGSIKGLTTAATLWFVACVGLAIGMGYYYISLLSFIGVMLTLVVLRIIQVFVFKHNTTTLEITFNNKKKGMDNVESYFSANDMVVHNIEFIDDSEEDVNEKRMNHRSLYTISIPKAVELSAVIRGLLREDSVMKAIKFIE